MDDELNEQPNPPEEMPGLNPDPAELREDARIAADEAAGQDVRDKIREVIDLPIADMLDDAVQKPLPDEGVDDDVADGVPPDMDIDDATADVEAQDDPPPDAQPVRNVPIADMLGLGMQDDDDEPSPPQQPQAPQQQAAAQPAAPPAPAKATAPPSPPSKPPARPAHAGVDPEVIRRARQSREAARKAGVRAPRRTPAERAAWDDWMRMHQGLPPEDEAEKADDVEDVPVDDMVEDEDDSPSNEANPPVSPPPPPAKPTPSKPPATPPPAQANVPVDDLLRPGQQEPVAAVSDRKNNVDVTVPQGNDKELNDEVVEMLRRYLDQERAWKRTIMRILENALQMLMSDHARLEQLEAAFERGRESY